MEVIKINKILKKSWKEHILVERRFYFHFASVDALMFHLIRNKISFEISECFLEKKKKSNCLHSLLMTHYIIPSQFFNVTA